MKYALIGGRLGHSYSKIIHEKYFAITGEKSTYDLVEVEEHDLERQLQTFLKNEYIGYNVTIPYKIAMQSLCTFVSEEATKIGSVNTIKLIDKEHIEGYNTDYYGLKLTLETNKIDVCGKRVVVLGTGGASKSVVTVCKDLGCSCITMVSRTKKMIKDCISLTYDDNIEGDILFNTTPVGMYPDVNASPLKKFSGFEAVIDLIYNPSETKLMKIAAANGIRTVNGLYMLVAQALYSQSIWNDCAVNVLAIQKIYEEMRSER